MRTDDTRMRILFVDDEPAILNSLRRILRCEQDVWDMTFLDCPHAALAELLRSDFDAVVTDVQMPGMDGLQLLQRLRLEEKTCDVPVVVLTGLTDHGLKRKALDIYHAFWISHRNRVRFGAPSTAEIAQLRTISLNSWPNCVISR